MKIIQCTNKDIAWRLGDKAVKDGWKFQTSHCTNTEYIYQVAKGLQNIVRYVAPLKRL